jgi:hypothetical protein
VGDTIFGGTGTVGHLFSYHIPSNTCTDLGVALPTSSSVPTLLLHNGLIYGSAGSYSFPAHLFAYDPGTHISTDLGEVTAAENDIPTIVMGADGLIYGGTGYSAGYFFSYDPNSRRVNILGITPGGSNAVNALAAYPDGAIYGINNLGRLFTYSPASDITDLGYHARMYTLVKGGDGSLYGGGAFPAGNFYSYRLSDGQFTDYGEAVWGMQSIPSMIVASDGTIYGGGEQLFVFNPTHHPYLTPGSASSVEVIPGLQITPVGVGYWEPYSITSDSDGILYLGGETLMTYDPVSGKFADLGAPVPAEYSVASLATGRSDLIYGGTDGLGYLFVYNPNLNNFTNLGRPEVEDNTITALTTGKDGRIYGGTGYSTGTFFAYEPLTHSTIPILLPYDYAWGVMALTTASSGMIYGSTYADGNLFSYDPHAHSVSHIGWVTSNRYGSAMVAAADGSIYIGTNSDGTIYRYNPINQSLIDLGQPVANSRYILSLVRSGDVVYGLAEIAFGNGYRYQLFSYSEGSTTARLIGTLSPGSDLWTLGVGGDGILYSGANTSVISFDPSYSFTWGQLNYSTDLPEGTSISVDVLSVDGALLAANVPSGKSLATINAQVYPNLRLRANLTTTNGSVTPQLEDWQLGWSFIAMDPAELHFWLTPLDPDLNEKTVSLVKTGKPEVEWTAEADQRWLSVEPSSGTAPAALQVRVDKSGLPEQTYISGTVTLHWSAFPAEGDVALPVSVYIGETLKYYLPSIIK